MQRDPVDEAIETDVLIIGGGIAGSRAAIEAKRNNAHVLMGQMSTNIKSGKFNHEMREAVEFRHMLTVSEMIVRSSLMRKESRNRFQRSDYPEQDDENWLKHILVEKTTSGMKLTTIPVEFPYVKRE
jgi:succinate dehydrogenase / fumarate reductase flavoprotein subunit